MSKSIALETFQKVDIRIGKIIAAESFPKARKPAYRLKIDFGILGIKKSSAQITDLYSPKNLINKQVVAIVNFAPKQIADFMSECLVLGLVNANGHVVLLKNEKSVENGTQVL